MDTISLLSQSQAGDEAATNKLLQIIQAQHMPGRIRKYVNRNVLVQKDEIESEFLQGCWKAFKTAKLDIGNPIAFICWKGELAVLHLFRKQIREGVRVNCPTCGTTSIGFKVVQPATGAPPARKAKGTKSPICCSKCGNTNIETFMIVQDQSQVDDTDFEGAPTNAWDRIDPSEVKDATNDLFSNITYDIQVEEFRKKLSGRVLELFDKIVIEQINRDTSNNYLEEIATGWGVSTACVSVYLRKLRTKFLDHIADPSEQTDLGCPADTDGDGRCERSYCTICAEPELAKAA